MSGNRSYDSKQNFLHGALNLSIATALVKVVGMFYKLPIQNLLTEQGAAQYDVAYRIYSTIYVLATAGLPVAISKMVSESESRGRNESHRIFQVAIYMFLIVGLIGSGIMFFGADIIAGWMNAPGASPGIRAVAPSVLLAAFICPYRGYYQGRGNMTPTAVSQVMEAVGKLLFGVGLTFATLTFIIPEDTLAETAQKRDIYGAAAAIMGVSVGMLLGVFYMLWRSRKQHLFRKEQIRGERLRARGSIAREMLSVAIPITLSSSVLSIANLIDAGLVRSSLLNGAGFSVADLDLYTGSYSYAVTLYNLPTAFIMTLSVSLLPAIAAARVRRDYDTVRGTVKSALRVTALIGMPMASGLICLAGPILGLLYPSRPVGVAIATPLMQVLGVAIIFACTVTVSNSVLQSLGLVNIPIITMAAGCAVKIVCTFVLVSNPGIHINGAPIGTVACFALISILNLLLIIRVTGSKISLLGVLVKPLAASACMGVIALGCFFFFRQFIGEKIGALLAIVSGVSAYFILLLLLRGLPREDVEMLPGGRKIANFLKL